MGFSLSAVALVFLIAFLYFGGSMAQSYLSTQREVRSGFLDVEARLESARQGALRIDNTTFDGPGQELTVNATNTGSVIFDANRLDVLIDGVVRTLDVTASKVNDADTNVWSPGTRLELRIDLAGAPSSAVLVTATGASAYWRA